MAVLLDHHGSMPLTFSQNVSIDREEKGIVKGEEKAFILSSFHHHHPLLSPTSNVTKGKKVKISRKKSNRIMTSENMKRRGLEEEGVADPLSSSWSLDFKLSPKGYALLADLDSLWNSSKIESN